MSASLCQWIEFYACGPLPQAFHGFSRIDKSAGQPSSLYQAWIEEQRTVVAGQPCKALLRILDKVTMGIEVPRVKVYILPRAAFGLSPASF